MPNEQPQRPQPPSLPAQARIVSPSQFEVPEQCVCGQCGGVSQQYTTARNQPAVASHAVESAARVGAASVGVGGAFAAVGGGCAAIFLGIPIITGIILAIPVVIGLGVAFLPAILIGGAIIGVPLFIFTRRQMSKKMLLCPHCKSTDVVPVNSRRGQDIVKRI